MPFDPSLLSNYTQDSGVYLMKDKGGVVIYVGKAKNIRQRLKNYFASSGDSRNTVPHLISKVETIETIIAPSEKEALILENTLIKKHSPRYNILLKDDKTFISLMVNYKHQWPMIRIVRLKGAPEEGYLYFGPYPDRITARETLELLSTFFPLRQCSDRELYSRERPCLLYSIKRCVAPCVAKCTPEEYKKILEKAVAFLKGQDKEITAKLHAQMEEAAEALEFEKAGALLRKIQHIETLQAHSRSLVEPRFDDCDTIGLYIEGSTVSLTIMIFREGRLIGQNHFLFKNILSPVEDLLENFLLQHYEGEGRLPREILIPFPLSHTEELQELLRVTLHHPQKGDKKQLLLLAQKNAESRYREKGTPEGDDTLLIGLQEQLSLSRLPVRIACFDTSNLAGSDQVAAMVCFTDGIPDKARRRLFKVKEIDKGDDYGSMREVLRRHLKRAKEENDLPDLIIVDGGKGQLSASQTVFKELDIATVDLISLAKEESRHSKGMTAERIFQPGRQLPLSLPLDSPLLLFLQRIRDEAHRSAITYHKQRRAKRVIKSALDEIPGIGPTKKKRLLAAFGSVAAILSASEEALLAIPGITKKDLLALKQLSK